MARIWRERAESRTAVRRYKTGEKRTRIGPIEEESGDVQDTACATTAIGDQPGNYENGFLGKMTKGRVSPSGPEVGLPLGVAALFRLR